MVFLQTRTIFFRRVDALASVCLTEKNKKHCYNPEIFY